MTTNHKPALESRKGREVQTSILHSRDQPAHKQLKYRQFKGKLEELKKELREGEEQLGEPEKETYTEQRQRIQEKYTQDESDSDDGPREEEDGGGGSGSESESDSDDEAELLKELQKIKKEREEQLLLQQMEQKEEELRSKPQKSWRQDSLFKENTKKPEEQYVNDLVKSDFHKKFLDKYVR